MLRSCCYDDITDDHVVKDDNDYDGDDDDDDKDDDDDDTGED